MALPEKKAVLKEAFEARGGVEDPREALKGVRALVVGLARTGLSVSRFLSRCGASVTATDIRPSGDLPGVEGLAAMGVEVRAGRHREEDFLSSELVVVSPGVPGSHPLLSSARGKGVPVISDVELAWRFIDVPVIAVAGTNGKSTTTSLLGRIFEEAGKKVFVGGNIGTPVIEYVEGVLDGEEKGDACILEISSFQLETTDTFNPHIGVMLNITEDHLDRYAGFDEYAMTKMRLFGNQGPSDYAVVNAADPAIAARKYALGRGRVVPFTTSGEVKEGLFLKGEEMVFRLSGLAEETYPVERLRLKGLQNIENAMAAIACARVSGIPAEAVLKTLSSYKGLAHRMELVRELKGVRYIDDSKGTNIGALEMALKGIEGRVVLIAGGRDKGGDYGVLRELVRQKVKLVIAIGEARKKIMEAFSPVTETLAVDTMEMAVARGHQNASRGDTVLLCPACSSFDMYANYAERGEHFTRIVEALP